MLSPITKRNLQRILPFGIIFLLFGWVSLLVELAAVDTQAQLAPDAIRMDWAIFLFASLSVTSVGLLVGLIEVIYLDRALADQSFSRKIGSKLLIYFLFFSLVILILYPAAASIELNTNILDARVWTRYGDFLLSKTNASTMVQLMFSLGVALFYAEISSNIGHRALLNFFTGKYHEPVEEERIFMFADMRSSTTIAEQLGHHDYFKLLKNYYADISEAIIRNEGELYQYVGDEVIISWPFRPGQDNLQCLHCFFGMQKALKDRAEDYFKQYGYEPTFKAGIHFGKVTTGEIGVVKKEIFFTGDVLNVTARIQGLCNQFEVDLLVSEELIQHLVLGPEWVTRSMGETELRGRQEAMQLWTVEKLSQGQSAVLRS